MKVVDILLGMSIKCIQVAEESCTTLESPNIALPCFGDAAAPAAAGAPGGKQTACACACACACICAAIDSTQTEWLGISWVFCCCDDEACTSTWALQGLSGYVMYHPSLAMGKYAAWLNLNVLVLLGFSLL